jgi:hypothetical protein
VPGLLIYPPGSTDSSTLIELSVGERLPFGRGTPDRPVGLRLDQAGVSRDAGEISTAGSFWVLSNHSSQATYLVENPEGAGEHVRVAPGRSDVPIPFEISRVTLPTAAGTTSFSVYAPDQPRTRSGVGPGSRQLGGEATSPTFALDTGAKYFLVLVALCEPRLREGGLAPVPTDMEVVRRLAALPGCAQLNRRAVNFHLDYLAKNKFRLQDSRRPGVGFTARRDLVVGFALRFGLVNEDHLALLPDREQWRLTGS